MANKIIFTALNAAAAANYDVDITNVDEFGRGYILVPRNGFYCYDGYMSTSLGGVRIYDRTGTNIKKYNLFNLSVLRNVGQSPTIIANSAEKLEITITTLTGFDTLTELFSQSYDEVLIWCKNIYIPPAILAKIVTSKLTLDSPRLTRNVLEAINCETVVIRSNYYPDFSPLKCKSFILHYDLDTYYGPSSEKENIPMMPSETTKAVIIIDTKKDHEYLYMTTGDKLESLAINGLRDEFEQTVILTAKMALKKLFTTVDVVMDTWVLKQLTSIRSDINEPYLSIETIGDKSRVNVLSDPDEIASHIELGALTYLQGDLDEQKYYLCMPNLKKLRLKDSIYPEYIPKGLKELHINGNFPIESMDELVTMCKHLMEMKTIRKMPLFLSEKDHCYDFSKRNDVYYDIQVIFDDEAGTIDVRFLNLDAVNVPQVEEALLANERCKSRNKKLGDLSVQKD